MMMTMMIIIIVTIFTQEAYCTSSKGGFQKGPAPFLHTPPTHP